MFDTILIASSIVISLISISLALMALHELDRAQAAYDALTHGADESTIATTAGMMSDQHSQSIITGVKRDHA